MTENKRFQYNWKTGRMKDTQSNSLATSNMRVLETIINDACYSYEKRIKELEQEVETLQDQLAHEKQRIEALESGFIKDLEAMHNDCMKCEKKYHELINELEKENEKLKQRIEEETDRVIKLEQYVYTKLCPKSKHYDEKVLSEIRNTILGDVK